MILDSNLFCYAKTTMNTNNQTHWIYHPKIRAILSTADVSEEEDGLADLSGLDASGVKALLTLLEQLDPESIKRTHNASPTQRQLLETCITYDGFLGGYIFTRGDDYEASFDGLSFYEIFLPKTAWETASALTWLIEAAEVHDMRLDGTLYLRFWRD
jgi:hypothetical protein